jgi:hypothetical protein
VWKAFAREVNKAPAVIALYWRGHVSDDWFRVLAKY